MYSVDPLAGRFGDIRQKETTEANNVPPSSTNQKQFASGVSWRPIFLSDRAEIFPCKEANGYLQGLAY